MSTGHISAGLLSAEHLSTGQMSYVLQAQILSKRINNITAVAILDSLDVVPKANHCNLGEDCVRTVADP